MSETVCPFHPNRVSPLQNLVYSLQLLGTESIERHFATNVSGLRFQESLKTLQQKVSKFYSGIHRPIRIIQMDNYSFMSGLKQLNYKIKGICN